MKIERDPDPAHRRIWDAIPWVVNGTATEAAQREVEAHLGQCENCREEFDRQSRLHGAILQVVANVAARGLSVEEAVEAPRIHFENGVAHCEDPAVADVLEAAGYPVVRWRGQNLFFGGVSAVEFRDDGSLAGSGDPRRGGAAVVVEA